MHTVRTGTILEETRLPLRHWAFALWSACSSKKGVSALQISRECVALAVKAIEGKRLTYAEQVGR